METTKGGARLSTSFESGVTGHGASVIIIDDPLTPADAYSSAARRKVINFYRESLLSRFDNPSEGLMVVVMQRLHEEDLAGYLLHHGGFDHLNLPAIAPHDQHVPLLDGTTHSWKEGDLLHEGRLSTAVLNEYRRTLSAAGFSAQYLQQPIPDEGDILKSDWIQRYSRAPDLTDMQVVLSWDTAIKGSPEADYSVCTIWAERNGVHYLLNVYRQKRDLPALVKDAAELYARYPGATMLVEGQGSGSNLSAYLKTQHSIYTIELRPKDDKPSRFSRASLLFEKGQVLFPEDAPWLVELEQELLSFPAGRHDDQVDSVSQYLNWAHERSGNMFKVHSLWDAEPHTPETLMDILAQRPRY